MPAKTDLSIWRGTSAPAIRFVLPLDITGSTFELTILIPSAAGGGRKLTVSTADGGLTMDVGESWVRWAYSPETSRLFPPGVACPYELERRIGGAQEVLLRGTITAQGGLNND